MIRLTICIRIAVLAGSAILLTACLLHDASAPPPDLPADPWTRDSAPLHTAGARGEDGLLDTAVADPDALYDADAGTWHIWYQTGRAREYSSAERRMAIRHLSGGFEAGWTVAATPALELPTDSSAWDFTHTETPSVAYDPDAPADRRYKMYYSGASSAHPLGFPAYAIGLAVSGDGRTFTRLPAEESPYGLEGLVLRAAAAFPDLPGFADGIVADPEVQRIDGLYHLWFSSFATDSAGGILAFGISHATSPDGIHWSASHGNPVSGLRNADNAGGQQPSVAWNPTLQRWEMWFTSDADAEKERIPSTFNPAYGFWMAVSEDGFEWTVDYKAARDVYWRPGAPEEALGLLTGADAVIVDGIRHLFYTAWGAEGAPDGFAVPVRGGLGYSPGVLRLLHATLPADR